MPDPTQPIWSQFPQALQSTAQAPQVQIPGLPQQKQPLAGQGLSSDDMKTLGQMANNQGWTGIGNILGQTGNLIGDTSSLGSAASSLGSGSMLGSVSSILSSLIGFI